MIGTGRTIHRARGDDLEGILTIGKAGNLNNRLRQFWRCASNANKKGHMAGWRFQQYQMEQMFPLHELTVCWRTVPDPVTAAREEAILLKEYVFEHLENPPLNYCASWAADRKAAMDV